MSGLPTAALQLFQKHKTCKHKKHKHKKLLFFFSVSGVVLYVHKTLLLRFIFGILFIFSLMHSYNLMIV